MEKRKSERKPLRVTRRDFIKKTTIATGAAALASSLPAPWVQAANTVKIGFVTPRTGPLAAFAEADEFAITALRKIFADGVKIGGATHPLEIIVKDSQSNPNRASEVASDLIAKDKIDLMLVSWTPETTNPVSDQCELTHTPCISTCSPWQPWFFGRGGKPDVGFDWTYHFFWGLEDIIAVFTSMWGSLPNNKVVGALWPNDGDGNAWADSKIGFPPAITGKGFTIVDPGRYQNLTEDYSAQIAAFKKGNVEIVTGVPLPPDFTVFWRQAMQQGFHPKIASVGKALLFPQAVEALGDSGTGVSSEVWWTPSHPFSSSLTHQSAADLGASWEQTTGKQWTQPIGFAHAIFEVGIDVLSRTQDISKKASIRDAIASTKLDTIIGRVAWGNGPVKNVAKTPLVGGQWKKGTKHKFDLVVVENSLAKNIPAKGQLEPI
jgi:branched-chain amino acid transport system substrate-binding protein